MNKFKNTLVSLTAGIIITGLALSLNGCTEQTPLTSDDNETDLYNTALAKKDGQGNGNGVGNGQNFDISYPQSASNTFKLRGRGYTGGFVTVPNMSELFVSRNSLTPPPDVPWGEDVKITMTVDKVPGENQLIFSFDPHGCKFSKPAEIYFNWLELGIEAVKLYYIDENGQYNEQLPDNINLQGKWMSLYVDHFSRYAIGWGDSFK